MELWKDLGEMTFLGGSSGNVGPIFGVREHRRGALICDVDV